MRGLSRILTFSKSSKVYRHTDPPTLEWPRRLPSFIHDRPAVVGLFVHVSEKPAHGQSKQAQALGGADVHPQIKPMWLIGAYRTRDEAEAHAVLARKRVPELEHRVKDAQPKELYQGSAPAFGRFPARAGAPPLSGDPRVSPLGLATPSRSFRRMAGEGFALKEDLKRRRAPG
jgi:hypothetical protein